MNNQECKVKPEIVNVNSKEPVFFPFSIKTIKCSGSCNNINNPYAKLCVADAVKYLNVRTFNLMSRTNETRHIKWYETYKYKCRLDASVCNNKQRWNKDKCSCECKELIDKGICDKRFIWNPSDWEWECDKSCIVGEYLHYANCKCRKRVIDKLVEGCSENIDGSKMIYNQTLNGHRKVCNFCTIYIVSLVIAFLMIICISNEFIHFHWHLKRD